MFFDVEFVILCCKDIGKVLFIVVLEMVSISFVKEMVVEGVVVVIGYINVSYE